MSNLIEKDARTHLDPERNSLIFLISSFVLLLLLSRSVRQNRFLWQDNGLRPSPTSLLKFLDHVSLAKFDNSQLLSNDNCPPIEVHCNAMLALLLVSKPVSALPVSQLLHEERTLQQYHGSCNHQRTITLHSKIQHSLCHNRTCYAQHILA